MKTAVAIYEIPAARLDEIRRELEKAKGYRDFPCNWLVIGYNGDPIAVVERASPEQVIEFALRDSDFIAADGSKYGTIRRDITTVACVPTRYPKERPSWKNTLNSKLYGACQGFEEVFSRASQAGYPFVAFNERIYETQTRLETGLWTKDVE